MVGWVGFSWVGGFLRVGSVQRLKPIKSIKSIVTMIVFDIHSR